MSRFSFNKKYISSPFLEFRINVCASFYRPRNNVPKRASVLFPPLESLHYIYCVCEHDSTVKASTMSECFAVQLLPFCLSDKNLTLRVGTVRTTEANL